MAPGQSDEENRSPRVLPFYRSPFIDYRRYEKAWRRTTLEARRRAERWLGLEDFSHPYSHRILDLTGSCPDLVLCHNLHGGYFDLRALADLSHRVPVVVRLFNSWLLTGHCANRSAAPAGRWAAAAARPQHPPGDPPRCNAPQLVAKAWVPRWRAPFCVGGDYQWILDRAKQSLLAPAVEEWKLIPGGVDLDTFSPGLQSAARQELGLDPEAHIVLFVANRGPENPLKDFPTVYHAMVELGRRTQDKRIDLLAVGSEGPDERIAPGIVVRRLGYIRSPGRLASLYRAADVYVHAALEETFGLSVAEALACGAPVVTASRGGVLELVRHGRTALTVPSRAPVDLADAIARLLASPVVA